MQRRAVVLLLTMMISATAAAKERLAVMPLQAKRIPQQTADIMSDLVLADIDAAGRFQVIGANDINAMLGLERMKDAAGCSDVSCAAEIGGALGVRFLVTGSVGILGDEVLVQLTLIDVNRAEVVRRGQGVARNDESLYRAAVETAVAGVLGLGPAATRNTTQVITGREAPPSPDEAAAGTAVASTSVGAPRSPARFRFETPERDYAFSVEVMTMDGVTHRCEPQVRRSNACLLAGLAVGEARLSVDSNKLRPFADTFTVRDKDQLYAIQVASRASPGNVIAWTFGGLGLATGAALIGVGAPLGNKGLLYGGIPTAVVGAAVIAIGFLFDRSVDVNYPGIDAFF